MWLTAFNAARVARTNAHAVLNTASQAAKTFLTGARGILLPLWGNTYNQQWAAAGWTGHSTAMLNTQPGRLELVQAIQGFLTANPAMEATTPGVTFTAAQAGIVAGALAGGLSAVGNADVAVKTAFDNRAADKALRVDMRSLITILSGKLTPNDPRWAEFGLNAPGAAVTPKAPTGLQGQDAGPAQVYVTCAMPAGADHLQWFCRVTKLHLVTPLSAKLYFVWSGPAGPNRVGKHSFKSKCVTKCNLVTRERTRRERASRARRSAWPWPEASDTGRSAQAEQSGFQEG